MSRTSMSKYLFLLGSILLASGYIIPMERPEKPLENTSLSTESLAQLLAMLAIAQQQQELSNYEQTMFHSKPEKEEGISPETSSRAFFNAAQSGLPPAIAYQKKFKEVLQTMEGKDNSLVITYLRLALSWGADVNYESEGITPLWAAAIRGDSLMVQYLLTIPNIIINPINSRTRETLVNHLQNIVNNHAPHAILTNPEEMRHTLLGELLPEHHNTLIAMLDNHHARSQNQQDNLTVQDILRIQEVIIVIQSKIQEQQEQAEKPWRMQKAKDEASQELFNVISRLPILNKNGRYNEERIKRVKRALQNGAYVNGANENGALPLWVAAMAGDTRMVELLLEQPGIWINPPNPQTDCRLLDYLAAIQENRVPRTTHYFTVEEYLQNIRIILKLLTQRAPNIRIRLYNPGLNLNNPFRLLFESNTR